MTTQARIPALALLVASANVMFAQSYSVTTIAGTDTIRDGIPAAQAFLRQPQAVQVDSAGNIYVLDQIDSRVRRIDPTGIISTVAGNGLTGFSGDGGPALNASFNKANDIALDRQGLNLYIADTGNNRVRQVNLTTGNITTFAGNGLTIEAGDGVLAVNAPLSPTCVTADAAGNVYIGEGMASTYNSVQLIHKVDAATGLISIFAGSVASGYAGDGAIATKATLNGPSSMTTDSQYLYFTDSGNRVIRRIDLAAGIISTFAGGGKTYCNYDCATSSPTPLLQAAFAGPTYLNGDGKGDLLIMDYGSLEYIAAGSSTIAGVAGMFYVYGGPTYLGDGAGTLQGIQFNVASGVAIAGAKNYLIADVGNRRLRQIKNGGITTIAGLDPPDGLPATSTMLSYPSSAAIDNFGNLFIADTQNNRFRKAAAGTGIVSTVLATGDTIGITLGPDGVPYGSSSFYIWLGLANPQLPCELPQSGYAVTNCFYEEYGSPQGIRFDGPGAIIIANSSALDMMNLNHLYGVVYKLNLSNGATTTLAGNGSPTSGVGENVPATSVGIIPVDVALDAAGNIYVADIGLWRIRKIDATSGLITTVAGGTHGNGGDGGPALKAGFNNPAGVTVDSSGNIFVADLTDMTIRRVDAKTGIITRIAGTGDNSHPQDSGAALGTSIGATSVLALADGSLLVTDTIHDRIRKLVLQRPAALSISAGDGQTGATGAAVALVAQVTDASGLPVAYVPVTFSVTSGTAQLATPTVQTIADGTATGQVTLGLSPGTVTVRASAPGLASVTFTINVIPPFINNTANGVTGLPMSNPPVTALSINGLMQISGQGFLAGGGGTAGIVGDGDLVNGKLPTVYQGVCVTLSGTPAPLLAASSTQIIFQVPALAAGGTADVSVTTACGTGQDLPTPPVTLPVQTTTPEFFYTSHNADGTALVAAMSNATGQPAPISQPGDVVTVYLTGLGATDSTNPGDVLTNYAGVNAGVTLQLGAETIAPDWVTTPASLPGAPYITSIGENAGVYLIQFTIPADAPGGNLPLIVTTGDGTMSPTGAYLTIAQPATTSHAAKTQ